jgi:hypothetical protein
VFLSSESFGQSSLPIPGRPLRRPDHRVRTPITSGSYHLSKSIRTSFISPIIGEPLILVGVWRGVKGQKPAVNTTCLSHPNHPAPNTLPDLGGSANLSAAHTPRKGPRRARFGACSPHHPARRPTPDWGRCGSLQPPTTPGRHRARWPVPPRRPSAPPLAVYGVAGSDFFGSIRIIQSPFSMSFT